MASARGGAKRDPWIFLIGLFKLFKGISLLIATFGLLKLLHRDVGTVVQHWIEVLRVDPDNRFIHRALLRIFNVTPKQLRELSAGTFIYAAIFLTEGTGLVARKHWAEYMTLISTGLFIPLEVYEISLHVTQAGRDCGQCADRVVSRGTDQAQVSALNV
jgi:uncharacterized membrane protein (DUF2068 family)